MVFETITASKKPLPLVWNNYRSNATASRKNPRFLLEATAVSKAVSGLLVLKPYSLGKETGVLVLNPIFFFLTIGNGYPGQVYSFRKEAVYLF